MLIVIYCDDASAYAVRSLELKYKESFLKALDVKLYILS